MSVYQLLMNLLQDRSIETVAEAKRLIGFSLLGGLVGKKESKIEKG